MLYIHGENNFLHTKIKPQNCTTNSLIQTKQKWKPKMSWNIKLTQWCQLIISQKWGIIVFSCKCNKVLSEDIFNKSYVQIECQIDG